MTIAIRQATVDDAGAIAHVQQDVWPHEVASDAGIASAIVAPNHRTFVATDAGRVIGFIDGFLTVSSRGVRRWEVDLLAVHPRYHGQHIGTQLLHASTASGQRMCTDVARGLVQINNVASQRVFMRCGYVRDETVYGLYVATNDNERMLLTQNKYLVAVHTFRYRGFWVEAGDPTEHNALPVAQSGNGDVIGALLAAHQAQGDTDTGASGLPRERRYQWWIRSFSPTF